MVIRKRWRSILVPLALYAASGSIAGYFVFQAQHGQRGLETKRLLKAQIMALNVELSTLKNDHGAWDKRLALMSNDTIDQGVLEQQARLLLGRVHRNDVVIMLKRDGSLP